MDLKSGHWQIEVNERYQEKTAFVTLDGLYELNGMPFALCTPPALFQSVMDTVLTGLKLQSCTVYFDNVVVFTSDFDKPQGTLGSPSSHRSIGTLMTK